MSRGLLTVLLAGAVALAGCSSDEPTDAAGASDASTSVQGSTAGSATPNAPGATPSSGATPSVVAPSPVASEIAQAGKGTYVDYVDYQNDPELFAKSMVVLFFWSLSCADCTTTDASLTGAGVPKGLTVVRIDVDNEPDAAARYQVGEPGTFVAVDDNGKKLDAWQGASTGAELAKQAKAAA